MVAIYLTLIFSKDTKDATAVISQLQKVFCAQGIFNHA